MAPVRVSVSTFPGYESGRNNYLQIINDKGGFLRLLEVSGNLRDRSWPLLASIALDLSVS